MRAKPSVGEQCENRRQGHRGLPRHTHASLVSSGSPGVPGGFHLAGVLDRTRRFLPLTSFFKHMCKTPELLHLSMGHLPQIQATPPPHHLTCKCQPLRESQ